MKRSTLFLLLFFAALPAFGQGDAPIVGVLTASASTCQPSTNLTACVFMAVPKTINAAYVTLAGTFSGTFQFEVSGDAGATWQSVSATPTAGGSAVTSATTANTWQVNIAGASYLRVRCSAYSSGSATATLNPSEAVTASSGGGGSMTWPLGGAGIPNYTGSSAWGTSYSSGNQIPANFISTLNQNTTGTAGGLSGSPSITVSSCTGCGGAATKVFLTSTLANTFSAAFSAQNLAGLSFSVAANTNYIITCNLQYVVTTTGTAIPNFAVTGPASPTQVSTNVFQNGGTAIAGATSQQTAAAFPTQIGSNATTATGVQLQASIVIMLQNGANSGTVQLQAGAQGIGTVTFTSGQSACVMN